MEEVAIHSSLEFKNLNGKEISQFTEQFKNSLNNSFNPKIFIVVGKTREGKSTLMNHILLDKSLGIPQNLRISSPFRARGGEDAITKEFLFYGPIKASEFCRRNNLAFNEEDYDLFFIDTEGSGNLYQMSRNLYHGIFSLESITTCILFISKGIIDQEGILYISRHIQTSKLFNSTSDNSFPGLAIIGRDIGIQDYDIPFEQQEIERINQDQLKLNDIKLRLNQNTGINFTEQNLKYIAEPPLDMPQLFFNSIKDLCKFIIDNSKIQLSKSPRQIDDKFKQHEKLINKYPSLLDTNTPMEDTIKNIFSIELQEVENKIKNENEGLIFNKINNLTLLEISTLQKDVYLNKIISEIKNKYEIEANSRYNGMKKIIEAQYNLSLSNLLDHFKLLIENKINEKIKDFINQMKNFIEMSKNESEVSINKSICEKIEGLTSHDLRKLNIEQYINLSYPIEIQKFEEKANSLFPNLKDIPQTKDLYLSKLELLRNFIKFKIQEQLNIKLQSCPPWPKNIDELLKEQKIDKLIPGTQYTLYFNKKPYKIIAKTDGKIGIPNIKASQYNRHEELPCWRNRNGLVYSSSYSDIDNWFEPEIQTLKLSNGYVYQKNWSEGGHKTLFGWGDKPPRPQQQKSTLSIHIENPWSFKTYETSGNVNVSLSNKNHDMFISGSGGSVQNIKLNLNEEL